MSDVQKLVEILAKSRNSFFHFTDRRNLPAIRQSGLLSMRAQREKGQTAVVPGGNQWSIDADRRSGMDAYVHLCFFSEHPMEWVARKEGRIGETVFLKIAPQALLTPGTMIVDTVSNRAGANPRPAEEIIKSLDLKVIYTRTDWKDPEVQERLKIAKKYEILVPGHIPVSQITS